jgi:hypothetical protein
MTGVKQVGSVIEVIPLDNRTAGGNPSGNPLVDRSNLPGYRTIQVPFLLKFLYPVRYSGDLYTIIK